MRLPGALLVSGTYFYPGRQRLWRSESCCLRSYLSDHLECGIYTEAGHEVEQQSWNTLSRQWEKATLVWFTHGEQRINLHTQNQDRQHGQKGQHAPILLRSCEVIDLVRLRRAAEIGERRSGEILKKAS